VLARPKDKAETYNAIENDHDGRKYRVSGDALAALGPGNHDRDNEPGFDHRHRDREKDRAKRLAKLERKHFGVMDAGEHRCAEKKTSENKRIRIIGGTIWANFRARSAVASSGIAQAQAGMEAWCDDDIGPFRCKRVEVCKRRATRANWRRAWTAVWETAP
jgi:hypothetical protein